jgi:ferredoxin-NADP reductase
MSAESPFAARVIALASEAEGVLGITFGAAHDAPLPAWEPGAHIDVILPNGLTRQYSLCGDPAASDRWNIGVLRETQSRGGSSFLHDDLKVGDQLTVRGPRNHFRLVDARRYVFIAGGIGITPLLPMLRTLGSRRPWTLLYGGRSRASMAFTDLLRALPGDLLIRPQDEHGLLDLDTHLAGVDSSCAVYCCGPEPLVQAVERHAKAWPAGTLHVERFQPREVVAVADRAFEIVLARSGRSLTVEPHQTIVDALRKSGTYVETVCQEGTCGTCETAVLEGIPDHRDSVLSDVERASNRVMMLCCSRAVSDRLVLDL